MSKLDPFEAVPFLGALRVDHGPRDLLGRYFLREVVNLRAMGIEPYLSRDPDRVSKLGTEYESARPPLFPPFDPSLAGFGPESWFTLDGRKADGGLAFVSAGRLLRLRSTLREELESFRLFYVDPAGQRDPGDAVEISAPAADSVGGFVGLLGCYWVSPAQRGLGLAKLFPTLTRLLALTLWGVDFSIGFMRATDAERGLAEIYGEGSAERWIKFRGRWQDDSYLVSSTRAQMEANLQRDLSSADRRYTRTFGTLETNRLPSGPHQGSTSRS